MAVRIRHVLATFDWWQWLLAAVFLVALVAAGLFAARTVGLARYWSQHRDEPIQRWMPVPYVAHSYDVPSEVLWDALGLPPARPPLAAARRPLGEIAAAQGKTFEQVKATLEQAIAAARAADPPPSPGKGSNRGGP